MSFGIIISKRNIKKNQNYVIWIEKTFIVYIKTNDIYKDIAKDVGKLYGTSDYIPLLKGKNKKVIGLMKYELGGKIVKEFIVLRAKLYSS